MGIRDQLNRNQTVSIIASLIAIVLVLVWICVRSSGTSIPTQLNFYTTDDGATLFSDDSGKVPPFDHGGQQAVRAFVFTCDNGQHQFVQYLEKYSDQMKQQLETSPHEFGMIANGLIKRPGDAKWISESDPKAHAILQPKCPDGNNTGTYRQVYP
jgi:hypothetical protein